MRRSHWTSRVKVARVLLAVACCATVAAQTQTEFPTQALGEAAFAQTLVQRNLELQYAKRSVDVAHALARGESGVYEPIVFGGVKHTDTQRQRSVEEVAANIFANSQSLLDEESRLIELGVKARTGWGGDLSLSAQRAQRRSNILLNSGTQLEVNAGIALSYRQPLARGRGAGAVETDWKVAQLEARATAWQYRQQLQKIVAEGLSLYWQIETADRIVAARQRLVELAAALVESVRQRVAAGKLAPLAVGEIEREHALRQGDLLRAEQTRDELRLRMMSSLNADSQHWNVLRLAADYGQTKPLPTTALEAALAKWAPLRVAQLRQEQGRLRLAYAENQALPTADLVLTHRQSGLADSTGAWAIAKSNRYPEWSLGLNVELGVWGERRAAAQQLAQQERVRQSQFEIDAIRIAFRNDWFSRQRAWTRVQQEIGVLKTEVQRRWDAWQAQGQRQALGMGGESSVWTAQQDWLDSQVRLLDAQGRGEAARLSLLLAQGDLLAQYHINETLIAGD